MAYEPTTWLAGDTISAARLNKIENGICELESGMSGASSDGSILLVSTTASGPNIFSRADYTGEEIVQEVASGKMPILHIKYSTGDRFIFPEFVIPSANEAWFTYIATPDGMGESERYTVKQDGTVTYSAIDSGGSDDSGGSSSGSGDDSGGESAL